MSFGYDRMAKKHTCNQPNYSIGDPQPISNFGTKTYCSCVIKIAYNIDQNYIFIIQGRKNKEDNLWILFTPHLFKKKEEKKNYIEC